MKSCNDCSYFEMQQNKLDYGSGLSLWAIDYLLTCKKAGRPILEHSGNFHPKIPEWCPLKDGQCSSTTESTKSKENT